MNNGLNARQNTFVKQVAAGNSATRAAVLSGYSKKSARFTASKLLTNSNILQHLEELFSKAGLSDDQLIYRLKTAIDSGIGKRANNSDAIKGLKMAFELKNRFPSTLLKTEVTQEDEVKMSLQNMSEAELMNYLEEISIKTQHYVESIRQRRIERLQKEQKEIELPQPQNNLKPSNLQQPTFGVAQAIPRPVMK